MKKCKKTRTKERNKELIGKVDIKSIKIH
jgi:hypothetical protein